MYMVKRKAYVTLPQNLMGMMTQEIKPGLHDVLYFKCWHLKRQAKAYIKQLCKEQKYSEPKDYEIITLYTK